MRTFYTLDANSIIDFPKIDLHIIKKSITFGWYQLNQGLSYLAEHFDVNGKYEINRKKRIKIPKTK
jgi:hypothetical protein